MSKKKKTVSELLGEALLTEDEQPFEIPENWEWVKIGGITDVVSGGTPKTQIKEYYEGGEIAWISPADLSGYEEKYISYGKKNITQLGLAKSSAKLMPRKTVLLSTRAPIGYVVIANNELSTNQGFKSFLPNESYLPEYLYWYLKNSKGYLESMASGTTFKELSGSKAKEISFPLAPIKEQERIVGKIEILFAKLDEAIRLIEETKKAIEVRRATILDRVLKNLEAESDIVTLAELVEFQNGLSKRSGKVGEEVVVLRLADIKNGNIDLSNSRKIILTDNERENYGLNKSDILFIRVNGSKKLVGTAIIVESEDEMAFCDHLIRGTINKNKVTESFVKYIFESNYVRSQIDEKIVSSAGQNTISQKSLGEINIPLPSIEEMNRVTEYLDKVFEQEILSFKQIESINLKAIQQAILSKAFKGELGTYDSTDEPAIELLKSILQEKL